MDMAFEYRKAFGPIEPGMSWHEVLAGAQRVRGFELRECLLFADAQLMPPAVNTNGIDAGNRAKYERAAYPEKRKER